jgi:hypothetical protein
MPSSEWTDGAFPVLETLSSRAATILARRMGKAPSVHSPEGMAERSVHNYRLHCPSRVTGFYIGSQQPAATLFCGEYCRTIIDRAVAITQGASPRGPEASAMCRYKPSADRFGKRDRRSGRAGRRAKFAGRRRRTRRRDQRRHDRGVIGAATSPKKIPAPDALGAHRLGKRVADPAAGPATTAIKRLPIIKGIRSRAYLDRLALDQDRHRAAVSGPDQSRVFPQGRPQPAT